MSVYSGTGLNAIGSKALLGDILAVVSAGLYAVFTTIQKKLPDYDDENSHARARLSFLDSLASLTFRLLGLFNLSVFNPLPLISYTITQTVCSNCQHSSVSWIS